jgi:hypothetical protein
MENTPASLDRAGTVYVVSSVWTDYDGSHDLFFGVFTCLQRAQQHAANVSKKLESREWAIQIRTVQLDESASCGVFSDPDASVPCTITMICG